MKPGKARDVRTSLHIVGAKPGEAPTKGWQSHWLFTLSARSLVKQPLKGGKAGD
jgi:hypothetical protein